MKHIAFLLSPIGEIACALLFALAHIQVYMFALKNIVYRNSRKCKANRAIERRDPPTPLISSPLVLRLPCVFAKLCVATDTLKGVLFAQEL